MRLWASTDSMTMDQFVPHIGSTVEIALLLRLNFIGRARVGKARDFPLDLSKLGERGLVQLPNLGPTTTALTGTAKQSKTNPRFWTLESAVNIGHLSREEELSNWVVDGSPIEALGSLVLVGTHLIAMYQELDVIKGRESRDIPAYSACISAKIIGFKSMCLLAQDDRFGEWIDAKRYGDLVSDPDVMTAPVCLAELEVEA